MAGDRSPATAWATASALSGGSATIWDSTERSEADRPGVFKSLFARSTTSLPDAATTVRSGRFRATS